MLSIFQLEQPFPADFFSRRQFRGFAFAIFCTKCVGLHLRGNVEVPYCWYTLSSLPFVTIENAFPSSTQAPSQGPEMLPLQSLDTDCREPNRRNVRVRWKVKNNKNYTHFLLNNPRFASWHIHQEWVHFKATLFWYSVTFHRNLF